MAVQEADFIELDTGSTLQVTCVKKSDGSAINLSGYTATLKYSINGRPVERATMTLVTPASGIVSYQFGSGELLEPGQLTCQVELRSGTGRVINSLSFIRAIIGGLLRPVES